MFRNNRKKILIATSMVAIIFISVAASYPDQPNQQKRNLKVLPANISHDSLDHLMDEYKFALKVNCAYCHARSKADPQKRDMASDDNPMKNVTRKMILMTNELNQKYIGTLSHPASDSVSLVQVVTCNTCHRGEKRPIVATLPIRQEEPNRPLSIKPTK